MKIYIYVLMHPTTKEIRYVGKTNNIKNRLFNHLSKASQGKKSHLYSWIKSLSKYNLIPIMEVVDEVDDSEWGSKEKYWISFYKEKGCNLCNMTHGGDTGPGGFVDADDKLKKAITAISLLNTGISQTEAEITSGLYKGFLSQLRRGHIPYLLKYNLHVPKSNYTGHIKAIEGFKFKKGYSHSKKGVPKTDW